MDMTSIIKMDKERHTIENENYMELRWAKTRRDSK